MLYDDVSSLIADAEFRNDILNLKQLLDNKHFDSDVIKCALQQPSHTETVEFVGRLVEATDDHLRT